MSVQKDNSTIANTLEKSDYHALDASGLICPEPVMLLHKQMRKIKSGEVIKMTATDSSTERDVPRFCEYLRHALLLTQSNGNQYVYWIRKRQQ